jgi:hypothetical protein
VVVKGKEVLVVGSILILFFDEREYSYAKSGLKGYGIMKDFVDANLF